MSYIYALGATDNIKMTHEFEVLKVKWHHNRGNFIFARHLGDRHDLDIPDGSLFGDIPICNYTEMRPLKGEDGAPRFDIFVLRPVSMQWLADNHFAEGQHVKLITE
jgi:hypothetical protein